jgi:hypothetical protein
MAERRRAVGEDHCRSRGQGDRFLVGVDDLSFSDRDGASSMSDTPSTEQLTPIGRDGA